MNTQLIYKHADGCLLEDMDGDCLLYNPNNATTLQLNASSMMVWQLCDGQRRVADIIHLLQESYPEQATQISDDVVHVITELVEQQVLTA